MGTLRLEKENAMRAEAQRKRHEIERKRREVDLVLAQRDLQLEAAHRDLCERGEELEALRTAETAAARERTQRQDVEVSKRDAAVLRQQTVPAKAETAPSTPAPAKPRRRKK